MQKRHALWSRQNQQSHPISLPLLGRTACLSREGSGGLLFHRVGHGTLEEQRTQPAFPLPGQRQGPLLMLRRSQSGLLGSPMRLHPCPT